MSNIYWAAREKAYIKSIQRDANITGQKESGIPIIGGMLDKRAQDKWNKILVQTNLFH